MNHPADRQIARRSLLAGGCVLPIKSRNNPAQQAAQGELRRDAAPNQVPQNDNAPALKAPELRLAEGTEVEYFSKTNGVWSPAIVLAVDDVRAAIVLDVKPQCWIDVKGEALNLRPRMKASKEKMLEVLDIFRKGKLLEESANIFARYAREVPGGTRGIDDYILLLEDIPALSKDIDEWFGCNCSLASLRKHFGPSQTDLRLGAFQEICWSILWWLNTEYCHALAKRENISTPFRKVQEVLIIEKKVGSGSYGSVYLGVDKRTGERRAVKYIKKESPYKSEEGKQRYREVLAREIGHLKLLDHPHIVRMYEHFEDEVHVYLVTEYCSGGELESIVSTAMAANTSIPHTFTAQVMRQVFSGIAYCHARGILHLDLKGGNIMLQTSAKHTILPGSVAAKKKPEFILQELIYNPHVVIIDFGVSKVFKPGKSDRPYGTPVCMAPEVWWYHLTPKADIFSLGVVLYQLFTLELPFNVAADVQAARDYWTKGPIVYWNRLKEKEVPASGIDLVRRMLSVDRNRRPTARDCVFDQFVDRHKDGTVDEDASIQDAPFKGADAALAPSMSSFYAQRISNYPGRCMLAKCIRMTLARSWGPHRMPNIKRLFSELDVSGMGRLDSAYVCQSLIRSGIREEYARSAVSHLIISSDGFIGWTEFVAAVIDLGEDRFDQYLLQIFNEADEDHDGLLTRKDIAFLLTADEIEDEALISETFVLISGRDGPGARVDWHTFRNYFRTKPGEADPAARDKHAKEEELITTPREEDSRSFMDKVSELWSRFNDSVTETNSTDQNLEENLKLLRSMGYTDHKRCKAVLAANRNIVSDVVLKQLSTSK